MELNPSQSFDIYLRLRIFISPVLFKKNLNNLNNFLARIGLTGVIAEVQTVI